MKKYFNKNLILTEKEEENSWWSKHAGYVKNSLKMIKK